MPGQDPGTVFNAPFGKTVCINYAWLPHITGVLEVLALPDYWEDPDTALPQVEDLIALLNMPATDNCEEIFVPECTSYPLTSSFFDWEASPGYFVDWVSGSGVTGGDPSNMDRVFIKIDFPTAIRIFSVEVYLSNSWGPHGYFWICPGSTGPTCSPYLGDTTIPTYLSITTDVITTELCVGGERGDTDVSQWGYITAVVINYSGDLEGGVPCT